MIPLQLMATAVHTQHLAVASPPPVHALSRTQEAIGTVTSLEEIEETLRGLPASLQPKGADQRSLPVVRLDLQRQLNQQIRALEKDAQERGKLQRLNELLTTLRVSSVSLILSVVYSGFAMGRPERGSWLQQLAWERKRRQDERRARLRARLELQAEMDAIRLHHSATESSHPGDGADADAALQAPRSGRWPWSKRVDPYLENLTGAHPDDGETQDASPALPTPRRDPPPAATRRQGRWPSRNVDDAYLEELAEAAAQAEDLRNAAAEDEAGRGV